MPAARIARCSCPLAVLAVAAALDVALASGVPVVDQYTLVSDGWYGVGATYPVGQSFTAGRSGTLVGIEVAAFRDGWSDPVPTGEVRLEIFDPEGASLGRITRPLAEFPDGLSQVPQPLVLDTTGVGYFDVSALGISVAPGQLLRFQMTPPGGGSCNLEQFSCVDGPPFVFCFFDSDCNPTMGLGSAFFSYFPGEADQGGTPTNDDIVFKTLVDVCGNDVLEADEECDDGGRTNGDCCDAACQFEPPTTQCRTADSACDVAEFCTGQSGLCPEDTLAAVGSPCLDDENPCTTDQCDQSGACTHVAGNAGEVCRVASDACDVAEQCDGSGTQCPVDSFAADSDGDAVCDLVDPCTNLSGGRDFLERPRATLALRTPSAASRPTTVKVRADFTLPLGVRFSDLVVGSVGARLSLRSSVGSALLETSAPGGTAAPPRRVGWKRSANGRSWTYRGPADTPIDAVESLKIASRGGVDSRQVSVAARLRSQRFEARAGDLPLGITIVLGDFAASSDGWCGEGRFTASDCTFSGGSAGVRCSN